MSDVLEAEGWGYAIGHFEESGFIHFEDAYGCVFAYHSSEPWNCVREIIYNQWGRYRVWNDAALLFTSKMKNGKTNYVFEIFW